MDITVFKLDIDDPTFNAPFSGDKLSEESPTSESSGTSVKRILGLGALLVAAVLGGVFALKRRLGGEETESDDDHSPTPAMDEVEHGNRSGIRALIGLFFLILLTIAIQKKRASKESAPAP